MSKTLCWPSEVMSVLFDEVSVARMLPYMCKIEAEQQHTQQFTQQFDRQTDPITATVISLLTCPLQLCLNEVGVMPIAGRCKLIFPYNLMTAEQRQFVHGCLQRTEEWNICNGHILFKPSPQPLFISPTTVLQALCDNIFRSKTHTQLEAKLGLCNVILQRVKGNIPLTKSVQRDLNSWLQRHMQKRGTTEQGVFQESSLTTHHAQAATAQQNTEAPARPCSIQPGAGQRHPGGHGGAASRDVAAVALAD